ncbi:hypothetical protein [Streptomyces sp. NPDC000410]|uniref:SCO0607 family lipoprotein n=1 Tax=Streptomyces sp. NPDC000410 TaxID=3154254 RepID=UPI003316DA13
MPQSRPTLPRLTLAGVVTALLLTGCGGHQERVCLPDHYPVAAVNDTGSDCVADGEEPSEGWARYPQGKVPEHVGDKWDRYWSDKTVDENGRTVPQPA